MTDGRPKDAKRIGSPEELGGGPGGDAGAPRQCEFNGKFYNNGDTRPSRKGFVNRCKDGAWVEESLLDPTDPWQ